MNGSTLHALADYARSMNDMFYTWRAAIHEFYTGDDDAAAINRLTQIVQQVDALSAPEPALAFKRSVSNMMHAGLTYVQSVADGADDSILGPHARDYQEELHNFDTEYVRLIEIVRQLHKDLDANN